MIHIPNDAKVALGIRQGQVYNFSPKSGVDNHYFVVLNKNPRNDTEIYLAPFTTKKEKVLNFIEINKLGKGTCVEIKKGDCKFLPREDSTVIDCNRLVYTDLARLIELIDESSGNCNYSQIKQELMSKIIGAVKASKMVKNIIKESL